MKKLISLLLVVFMCLSAIMAFVACDTEEANEGSTTNKVETPTEAPTKAPENEETTSKEAASEENTTEETTTEETTTEEATTEETTTVAPESVKLTEEEWYALANLELYTNFTIITTQIDNFYKTVSTTKVVDGHVFVSYTTYNQSTGETNTNSGDASLEHVDKTTLTPDLKDYSKIEYDAERGVYYYTEPIEITDVSNPNSPLTITYTKYEWTVKDGRIHKIYNEFWYMDSYYGKISATQTSEYFNYGTTVAPDMPDVPGDPDNPDNDSTAPSITEEVWIEAFALDVDYLQVSMELYNGDICVAQAASNRARDVMQIVDSNFERMAIDYMLKINDGWYYYNDETESPDFYAERVYKKWFLTPEDCHGDDEFENTKNSPRDMISVFADKFDAFSYNEDKGGYFAPSVYNSFADVLVIFDRTNIQQITYTVDEYKYVIEFSYEEFAIFLPDATEVER